MIITWYIHHTHLCRSLASVLFCSLSRGSRRSGEKSDSLSETSVGVSLSSGLGRERNRVGSMLWWAERGRGELEILNSKPYSIYMHNVWTSSSDYGLINHQIKRRIANSAFISISKNLQYPALNGLRNDVGTHSLRRLSRQWSDETPVVARDV